ncbi:MAG TPA: HlyD family efflux transporter periplasmic adaptor subunit [Gemmatimonadaceae bacterium]|nr:HlyD family efflux transporter periplasmic adaptor subunit [Gemmatimonadaceae bacterium]
MLFTSRALLVLAIVSLAGTYVYRAFVATDAITAVACAPVVGVAAPIAGTVSRSPDVQVGARIRSGQELFRIVNDRFDERSLLDTRAELEQAGIEVARLTARLESERERMGKLEQAVRAARRSQVEVLNRRAERGRSQVEEAAAKLSFLEKEQARFEYLVRQDVMSRAELEAHTSAVQEQRARAAAVRAELVSAERLLDAARRGEVIEDSQVPSARYLEEQREEARRIIRGLTAELSAAERQRANLGVKASRVEALLSRERAAVLRAAFDGIVLQLPHGIQQEASPGDALLTYAHCDPLSVAALVRARVYERIGSGALRTARVRLGAGWLPAEIVALSPHPFPNSGLVPSIESMMSAPDTAGEYGYVLVKVRPETRLAEQCPVGSRASAAFAP